MTRLARSRRQVALRQARRFDRQSLQGLSRGRGATVLRDRGHAPQESILVDVPVVRDTLDHAANRAMAWMVRALAHRVVVLERWLETSNDEQVVLKRARRQQLLEIVSKNLECVLRRSPYVELSHPAISSSGLTAISADPVYGRAFRMIWQALRPGVDVQSGMDSLAIGPTWEVYERWCYLVVVDVVRELLPMVRWCERFHGAHEDRLSTHAEWKGLRISVDLQRHFAAWDIAGKSPFKSLSGKRIPDIVVTISGPGVAALLVLDAKYRASRRNVLDAMHSAHVYHDSLRFEGVKPWLSLLLVPDASSVAWLEDSDFQSDHGVGVIGLRERSQSSQLHQVVKRFFAQTL